MYQKHQDIMVSEVSRLSKKWEDYSSVNKIIEEEIFSKSIEFEPAWIGKIVLDGCVMGAWKMEKVWGVKLEEHTYNE